MDIYWLAGLLEGEGFFGNGGHSPALIVQMTDEDVIRRARLVLGAGSVVEQRAQAGRKPVWRLSLYGQPAIDWMVSLYPIMGRRRQGRIALTVGGWWGVSGCESTAPPRKSEARAKAPA